MAILDSGSAPSSRIESAVERELARRRRLLRLYVLLLFIPLGVAAWFLFSAGSEMRTQEVLDDRLDQVQERYEQIAPKLDQVETFDKALPVVQQAAEQLQAQEKQVETLQRQVQAVSSNVQEIAPVVQEIQANQASLMRNVEPSGEVKELSARLAAMERNLEGYQQISAQLARQEQRLAGIERQQRQVTIDLKEVEARVEKQPATPGYNLLDIQKLNERIRVLEQGTGNLRKDLYKIQTDVKEQKPPG
ncbi:MAG TPA: hypothetical protein VF756_17025 [Thermoanaerobaculia bacterium]